MIYVPGYDRDKHSRTQFLNRTKRRLSPALVGSRPFSLGGERTRLQFLRTRTIVYVLFFFSIPPKIRESLHFDRCNDKSDGVTAIVEKFRPASIAYRDCIDIYIYILREYTELSVLW